MTELEQRLIELLEQERQDRQREMSVLSDMLNEQNRLLKKVIDRLENLTSVLQEEKEEQKNYEVSIDELKSLLEKLKD